VGFSVKNMTNMYHLLLHSEEEHAHAQGGNENGSGVRRMDAMLMRIVDSSEGGGDMIGGGVEAQVFATRPERHSFHVVLKAYTDMVERSCTFKELKLRADLMEEIVKIMEQKSGVGGNGVTPSRHSNTPSQPPPPPSSSPTNAPACAPTSAELSRTSTPPSPPSYKPSSLPLPTTHRTLNTPRRETTRRTL